MTGALDRTGFEIAMRQDRIARVRLEWSPWTAAARDCFAVCVFGATFRNHQVVIAFDFVEMRTFGAAAAGAVPERLDL